MALTKKKKRFADEYLIDLNGAQAAIRAGYSAATARAIACNLLALPEIKEYVAERMAEKDKELIASQDEVLKYLTAVMRGLSESEIVVIEGVGMGESQAVKVQKSPDEKERLKAAELIGKRYGLFTDKVNIDGVVPVVISGEDKLED